MSNSVLIKSLFTAITMLLFAAPASAQTFGIQYGPRAFSPAPIGTNAINVKYEQLSARIEINTPILTGFEISSTSVITSYSTYFDLFGKTASFIAAAAAVKLEGEASTIVGPINVFEETGFADPYFQLYVPIIGGDAQSVQEFVQTEPGFILGAFVAAMPPLGEYAQSNLANTGTNRWQVRFGLPMQYIWGLPTRQTTVEFVPTVYLFSDNDELNGGGTLSQEPFFQLEAHLTRDFNQIFWGSLNVFYGFGGETSVNGVAQNDAIAYLSGGFTVGARISRSLSVNGSYSRRLYSKQSGADGNWFSLSTTVTF